MGRERTTIVTGVPRSGTSLMMQMLHAAPLPCVTDGVRLPDVDNPRGYFEAECVKRLRTGDAGAVVGIIEGRAVKIVYRLMYHLPEAFEADVLSMHRDLDEVLASQTAMLARQQQPVDSAQDARRLALYQHELAQFREWLARRPALRTLVVPYRELTEDPRAMAARVAEFLGRRLDVDAMSRVVDVSLYRQHSNLKSSNGMTSW
jgi:hypothetical protein